MRSAESACISSATYTLSTFLYANLDARDLGSSGLGSSFGRNFGSLGCRGRVGQRLPGYEYSDGNGLRVADGGAVGTGSGGIQISRALAGREGIFALAILQFASV